MISKFLLVGTILIATASVGVASKSSIGLHEGPRLEGVRTTAYSSGASHNGKYGPKNAIGQPLKAGDVRSAAADWSRYPLGTRFRVVETGQEYIVDDIGSAMVGTGTIDLYKPRERDVWKWGVRHVTIEIIEWGDPEESLEILSKRTKYRHVREMVADLRRQKVL